MRRASDVQEKFPMEDVISLLHTKWAWYCDAIRDTLFERLENLDQDGRKYTRRKSRFEIFLYIVVLILSSIFPVYTLQII